MGEFKTDEEGAQKEQELWARKVQEKSASELTFAETPTSLWAAVHES